jgi:MoaA/NifB/PqqE/SkfB family radical SAM enzyme
MSGYLKDILDIVKKISVVAKARCCRWANRPIEPRFLTYTVTWRCTAKCIMCDIWKDNFQKQKNINNELSASEIRNIFRDKNLQKIDVLRITGGEPMLKQDLIDIVKSIYNASKFDILYLTTNGLHTDRLIGFVQEMLNNKIELHLKISLDAVGALHDKIRGVEGAFNKVYHTLEMLKKIQKQRFFNIGINQTIMELNRDHISQVQKIARHFHFYYIPILVSPINENMLLFNHISRASPFMLENTDRKAMRDIFCEIKKLCNKMPVFYRINF